MLLQPRQDDYTNNLNNMSIRHHHHHEVNHNLSYQLTSTAPRCCSPRSGHRSKLPPHIKICPVDDCDVMSSHDVKEEKLDNHNFRSTTSSTPFQSNSSLTSSFVEEKHQVYSGSLYIIQQTGSSDSLSSSPTRSSSTPSVFRSSSPFSAQQSSPQNSPTSSPNLRTNRKVTVLVSVYRCNLDHFAVITRDVLHSGKPVYVNLRHSRVMPGRSLGRFLVVGKSDSGHVLEFEVPELSSLSQWLDAFQVYTPPVSPNRVVGSSGCGRSGSGLVSNTPPIPRSPALPTLTETDEED